MNKILLLTGNPFSIIPAGVEHFSELLKKVFPNLELLAFDRLDQQTIPFLTEPFKAKAVCQHLLDHLDALQPETVLFNGLYGWSLPGKTSFSKIGICHGTYASFSSNAMPGGLDRMRIQWIYRWFEQKSFQNADGIISNSAFTKKILHQDYGLNSTVVPFAIDFSVFKPQPKKKARALLALPPEKKIVLFVGRPDYSKGFDLLEKMSQQNPAWHFVCVTFPSAHSKTMDCRGPFDSKTLSQYYAASDAVLFPSRFESFGFVTLEALACHRPIVTTNFGIARELKHSACIVVKNHSVSFFQKALEEALSKEFSFEYPLEKQFGIERFAKQFKETVESFLGQQTRREVK